MRCRVSLDASDATVVWPLLQPSARRLVVPSHKPLAAVAVAVPCRHRRVKKEDMRRIAKATGASIVTTLADMEGNETFDPEVLGEAEEVSNHTRGHVTPGDSTATSSTSISTRGPP